MKIAVLIVVAAVLMCEVTRAAPAGTDLTRPDPMLTQLLAGINSDTLTRNARQNHEPMSPLGQLLQDALNIPQVALQAVSRLLTNPGNTIGQSTGARN